jgi:hypothetical protein
MMRRLRGEGRLTLAHLQAEARIWWNFRSQTAEKKKFLQYHLEQFVRSEGYAKAGRTGCPARV